MQKEVLRLSNVSTVLKNKKIIDNVSFSLYDQEILGLIGPSGSGKSVLLKTLSGFFKLNSGTIFSENKDLIKNVNYSKNILGFCTQDSTFYENLTVNENLEYFGKLYGLSKQTLNQNIENLIGLLELKDYENKLAKHLSGGTQRKLAIACSLIHAPRILILDEPTSGLDPVMRENVISLIRKVKKLGTSVLITSHFLNELEEVCDRIAILNNGKIVAIGTIDDLRKYYYHLYEITIKSSPGNYRLIYQSIINKIPVSSSYIKEDKLIIYTPQKYSIEDYTKYISGVLEKIGEHILNINVSEAPLEEIFKQVVKNVS